MIFGGGDIATRGIVPLVPLPISTADVTDYGAVAAALARNPAKVVINCAGVSHPCTVLDSEPHAWHREVAINLLGSYNVARAALEHGAETLIFIASVAGMYGKPNHSGYSASKAGVISLVQSLGMEGHRAFAISPGRVDTSMRERDYPCEDPRTRLAPKQVGEVVRDILDGAYEPGDNIVIRKIGFESHLLVDKGEPWRVYLRVGEPSRV